MSQQLSAACRQQRNYSSCQWLETPHQPLPVYLDWYLRLITIAPQLRRLCACSLYRSLPGLGPLKLCLLCTANTVVGVRKCVSCHPKSAHFIHDQVPVPKFINPCRLGHNNSVLCFSLVCSYTGNAFHRLPSPYDRNWVKLHISTWRRQMW